MVLSTAFFTKKPEAPCFFSPCVYESLQAGLHLSMKATLDPDLAVDPDTNRYIIS